MAWTPDPAKRRIVCAACLVQMNGRNQCIKFVGPRHWDHVMHQQLRNLTSMIDPKAADDEDLHAKLVKQHFDFSSEVQGFVDQFGDFFDRKEAFAIATRQSQIREKTGNPDSKELSSEDLY